MSAAALLTIVAHLIALVALHYIHRNDYPSERRKPIMGRFT